ncbi:MAG TPA: hypothetical protein VK449_09645 [Anaerolineales bacterium]|nr:hypothetical protein [Anaerolineales bacterium]
MGEALIAAAGQPADLSAGSEDEGEDGGQDCRVRSTHLKSAGQSDRWAAAFTRWTVNKWAGPAPGVAAGVKVTFTHSPTASDANVAEDAPTKHSPDAA